MSLSQMSTNLDKNSTLEQLKKMDAILNNSEATVSFWGTRQISYTKDRVSLTKLAKKVENISVFYNVNRLDESQRKAWISISQKITNFHNTSDVVVKNRNFITRFFVSVRECGIFDFDRPFFSGSLPEMYTNNSIVLNFNSYSSETSEIKIKELKGCVNKCTELLDRETDPSKINTIKTQIDLLNQSIKSILNKTTYYSEPQSQDSNSL